MNDKKTGITINTMEHSGLKTTWHADSYVDAAERCTSDDMCYNPIEYVDKEEWLFNMIESGRYDSDNYDRIAEYIEKITKDYADLSGSVIWYIEPYGDEYLVEAEKFDSEYLCELFICHDMQTCTIINHDEET